MLRISSLLSLPSAPALARVATERTALGAAVLELSRRRDGYLLADASDAIIASIDAETDRLHLALERLDAAERELLRRERAPLCSAVPRAFAAG